MKIILAALLAFAATAALAQPMGFFHQNDFAGKPAPRAKLAGLSSSCALIVRYNSAAPSVLEIAYVGGRQCDFTDAQAIETADARAKVERSKESFPPRPGLPAVYECSVTVSWDDPTNPSVTPTGPTSCDQARRAALDAAARAVRCALEFDVGSCTP